MILIFEDLIASSFNLHELDKITVVSHERLNTPTFDVIEFGNVPDRWKNSCFNRLTPKFLRGRTAYKKK